MSLNGARVAVAGMGVSGQAIARACISHGAQPTVYDQQLASDPARIAVVEQLQGWGAQVVTGWHGHLDASTFDILVASPGFRREHPAIGDALEGGREVISEVEFAYRISTRPILAITGTNGKSTSTVLLWLMLRAAGANAVLCGNIAGTGYPEQSLTQAALEAEEDAVLVAEVSSYQLEWVTTFRPKVAAITNITPDHLERHPSLDDYYCVKLRIFESMRKGDTVVFNESEPSLMQSEFLAAIPEGVRAQAFGADTFSLGVSQGFTTRPHTTYGPETLRLRGHELRVSDLALGGLHNVTNAAMAFEMACAHIGSNWDQSFRSMIRPLYEFRGLRHRMEQLGERDGVLVVNSSMSTNPAAVVASSCSLDRPQHLLMGGLTKNLSYEPVIDYLLETGHNVYLYGEDAAALDERLGSKWPRFLTLEAAFKAATIAAAPGDAILLLPGAASSYPYADFQERGEAFRRIAHAWLERKI